jgi:hypothetical protein
MPIKIAVEISTFATARSLLGSSAEGITDKTMVRAVERSPMVARVMATGRPPGGKQSPGVDGEADSLLLLQFSDDAEQIASRWVAVWAEHAHQAGFRDAHSF